MDKASWSLVLERSFRKNVIHLAVKATPEKPVWIVAPFALLDWLKEAISHETPACSVEFLTWRQFRCTLENLLLLPKITVASPSELQRAIAQAIRNLAKQGRILPELNQTFVQDPLGTSSALRQSLEYWMSWGSEPPHGAENLEILEELRLETEKILVQKDLTTDNALWRQIEKALESPVVGLPPTIILDGLDRLDRPKKAALVQLENRGTRLVMPPWFSAHPEPIQETGKEPERSIFVRHLRDPHQEAEHALRWVRERLQEGNSLREIAIMVPHQSGYEPILQQILEPSGIPIRLIQWLPLAASGPFQPLRAFLRLVARGVDVIEFVTLLRAGGFFQDPGGLVLVSSLYEKLPPTWKQVRDLINECKQDESISDRILQIIDCLESAPGKTVEELLEAFFSNWGDTLRTTCGNVLETYRAVMGTDPGIGDFIKALQSMGDPIEIEVEATGEALAIWNAGPYAPKKPKALLILGFNEGTFPRRESLPPLIGPLEIEAMQGVLPTSTDFAEHEVRNLWRMLDLAERIDLLVPERDRKGASRKPSPFLETIPILDLPSIQALSPSLALREWMNMAASRLAFGECVPGLHRLAADGNAEWVRALFPATGPFDPSLLKKLLGVLSPSKLDVLLQCSFAFYAQGLLRLEEQPPIRTVPFDAALAGTISHRVLELLLSETPDQELSPDQVAPILSRVLTEEYSAFDHSSWRFEIDDIRRKLEAFVAKYAELAKTLNVTGGTSEWSFGFDKKEKPIHFPLDPAPEFDALREKLGGDSIRIGGYVDRVLHREGRPIAIDFKSGDVGKYRKQREVGLGAQVALYSWAVAQKWAAPEAFAYLSIRNGGVDAVAASDGDNTVASALNAQAARESLEGVQKMISQACTRQLQNLLEGNVEPVAEERRIEFESTKSDPCRYCGSDLMCGIRGKRGCAC